MVAMFTVLVGLAVYVGWTVLSYNQTPDDVLIASSISQSEQSAVLIETQSEAAARLAQPAAETAIVEPPADKTPALQPQNAKFDAEKQTDFVSSHSNLLSVQVDTTPDETVPESANSVKKFQKAQASADSLAHTAPLGIADSAPKGVAALATAREPENEVIIRAIASAWIEVTRADGEVLVTKLMRDGDELVLSTSDDLFLSTGNAGGLRLKIQNMLAFDAGQTGEILRDLRLNRESLLSRQTQLTY